MGSVVVFAELHDGANLFFSNPVQYLWQFRDANLVSVIAEDFDKAAHVGAFHFLWKINPPN